MSLGVGFLSTYLKVGKWADAVAMVAVVGLFGSLLMIVYAAARL